MKTLFTSVFCLMLLSGCALSDAELQAQQELKQQKDDNYLARAEWATCNGASEGAVDRRYGASERLASYDAFCHGPILTE